MITGDPPSVLATSLLFIIIIAGCILEPDSRLTPCFLIVSVRIMQARETNMFLDWTETSNCKFVV